jgi:alpha-D-xyloside xylohydrolase
VSDGKTLLTEKSVRVLAPTTTTPSVPGFLSLDMAFKAVPGERIYGLGQHAAFAWDKNFPINGQLDQKNVPAMLMEPHDGDVTIPVAHSSLGYAFLSNLPSTGTVVYNDTGSHWRHDVVLQMDIWVATTSDSPPHAVSPWAQLQSAYADATGHAPVWPEWTTGFWQCKLRYANQTQIMAVASEYVRRNIPLSLIIIDFYSWNDPVKKINTIGDETLPASCWPDPRLMVQQLKEMGVELMVSPYSHSVGKASHNWPEALAKKYLATDKSGQPAKSYAGGFTYDLFNPEARAYAWNAMQKGYVDQYGLHHWCAPPPPSLPYLPTNPSHTPVTCAGGWTATSPVADPTTAPTPQTGCTTKASGPRRSSAPPTLRCSTSPSTRAWALPARSTSTTT